MKRFQQFPDEAARIGHILFWLFPYEQDTFRRGGTRVRRPTRGFAQARTSVGVRQIGRAGLNFKTEREESEG